MLCLFLIRNISNDLLIKPNSNTWSIWFLVLQTISTIPLNIYRKGVMPIPPIFTFSLNVFQLKTYNR